MKRIALLLLVCCTPVLHAQRTADVLAEATRANTVESAQMFASGDSHFRTSAAASIRLLEVQYATEEASGESLRQETYILNHKDELLNSYVDQKEAERRSATLKANGITSSVADELRRGNLTIAEKNTLYNIVQNGGVKALHKAVIASLRHKFLNEGETASASATASRYGGARLVRVGANRPACGLDSFDCSVIKIGAAACAASGDPLGALALGVWAACCC